MDNNRSISEKYSLDYYRHSLPTRAWKSRWNYLALLLALLAFGGMYLIGRNTMFQAAPVASVHSSFGTNCAACHDQAWGAGKGLVAASNQPHSVSNDACQKCHHATKHADISLAEPACAECHQEHRPEKRLTAIANSACTRCHSDLAPAIARSVSVVPTIRRFEAGDGGHPEFALLRPSHENIGKQYDRVAQFKSLNGAKGKWVDLSGLKFTHQLHLDPKRVLGPDRKPVQLTCADCHINGADGYMRPIKYEQHCSKCHPLRLVAPFAELGKLPHSTVEEVRGVIRDRVAMRLAAASPQKDSVAEKQFLRLPRPARLTADQERELLALTERAEQAILASGNGGTCGRCHYFGQRRSDWYVELQNPEFAVDSKSVHPPDKVEMVPSRWMRHAVFSHKSHRAVDCAECHNAAQSNQTSDILLPSVSVCRNCHGADAQTSSPHVSADCVLCHTYHMQPADKNVHGMPLHELFLNTPSKTAADAKR